MVHLLIVDDDPAIREVFSILLRKLGYTVDSAAGGEDCLDWLTRTTPDLVLLDIMMYPVDGWETLSAIRKNPRTAAIPTIMFSGKSPSLVEIDQYGEWIEDYFMKPISMQTITISLKEVFDRYRASREEREQLLRNGGDVQMIEEYVSLRRLLFIHGKFSPERSETDDSGRTISPRKARFEELGRKLSSSHGRNNTTQKTDGA